MPLRPAVAHRSPSVCSSRRSVHLASKSTRPCTCAARGWPWLCPHWHHRRRQRPLGRRFPLGMAPISAPGPRASGLAPHVPFGCGRSPHVGLRALGRPTLPRISQAQPRPRPPPWGNQSRPLGALLSLPSSHRVSSPPRLLSNSLPSPRTAPPPPRSLPPLAPPPLTADPVMTQEWEDDCARGKRRLDDYRDPPRPLLTLSGTKTTSVASCPRGTVAGRRSPDQRLSGRSDRRGRSPSPLPPQDWCGARRRSPSPPRRRDCSLSLGRTSRTLPHRSQPLPSPAPPRRYQPPQINP